MANLGTVTGELVFDPYPPRDGGPASFVISHQHEKREKKSQLRFVAWSFHAESVAKLKAGDYVSVDYTIEQNRYQDKQTQEWVEKNYQLSVQKVEVLDKPATLAAVPDPVPVAAGKVADDDIPF